MTNSPENISELVSMFGKVVTFAEEMGFGYEAARKMKDRNLIAPKHWPRVVDVCASKGISGVNYEWLATHYQNSDKETA